MSWWDINTFLEESLCLSVCVWLWLCLWSAPVTRGLRSSGCRLSRSLTLYIRTSQCSEVNASSRCFSFTSLFPISAFRVRSNPGGVLKSSWTEKNTFNTRASNTLQNEIMWPESPAFLQSDSRTSYTSESWAALETRLYPPWTLPAAWRNHSPKHTTHTHTYVFVKSGDIP